jgi:hypothetical protein
MGFSQMQSLSRRGRKAEKREVDIGLDMYLYNEEYIGDWENTPMMKVWKVVNTVLPAPDHMKGNHHYYIKNQVGYWRKANAIHAWFIHNCADDVDDCTDVYVPLEKLIELRDICMAIVEAPDRAESMLPTQSGFFFGGLDYNEWYMDQLKYTIEVIDYVLTLTNPTIYYRASW